MSRAAKWYLQARHTSHVTRHISHITHHTSHITHHTSHVTRHTSHITHHARSLTFLEPVLQVTLQLQAAVCCVLVDTPSCQVALQHNVCIVCLPTAVHVVALHTLRILQVRLTQPSPNPRASAAAALCGDSPPPPAVSACCTSRRPPLHCAVAARQAGHGVAASQHGCVCSGCRKVYGACNTSAGARAQLPAGGCLLQSS